MKIQTKDFRVAESDLVDLEKRPTKVDPVYHSKKDYKGLLKEHVAQLSALQTLHHASTRYALLLIFQAMDAAGKDGAIRHVMSGVNPQGCQVFSFKHPSATELEHDFLWRTTRDLPERGHIVPADDKENARLIVSQVVLDTFAGLKMSYPKMDEKREQELHSIRAKLAKRRPRRIGFSTIRRRTQMLKLIDGMSPGVLAVEAIGKVTDEDYRATLIPLAEKMLTKGPIRMLYLVGPEAGGFEPGALWDDAAFGFKHGHDFSDVAVVTDQPWLRAAASMFGPFIRARLRLFGVADLPEAKAWINQPVQV